MHPDQLTFYIIASLLSRCSELCVMLYFIKPFIVLSTILYKKPLTEDQLQILLHSKHMKHSHLWSINSFVKRELVQNQQGTFSLFIAQAEQINLWIREISFIGFKTICKNRDVTTATLFKYSCTALYPSICIVVHTICVHDSVYYQGVTASMMVL